MADDIFDGVPLDPDGEPEPPLNANKVPAPPAQSSSFGEEDGDARPAQ
jgi:hypothetical protein